MSTIVTIEPCYMVVSSSVYYYLIQQRLHSKQTDYDWCCNLLINGKLENWVLLLHQTRMPWSSLCAARNQRLYYMQTDWGWCCDLIVNGK